MLRLRDRRCRRRWFLVLLAKDARTRSEIEERLAQTQAILYSSQVATETFRIDLDLQ